MALAFNGPNSGLCERRLEQFSHWQEILVRLQHRWTITSAIAWHKRVYPGEPVPTRMTLWRYLKTKPETWYVSRLLAPPTGSILPSFS